MTRLEGFRCDECGAESRTQRGKRWTEVRSLMLTSDGWSMITQSDGLHYCSRACLLAAIPKWEKERQR